MRVLLIALLSLVAIVQQAHAQLTMEITKGVDNPISIAVVPFDWQGSGLPKEDVSKIIEADLFRTGQFSVVSRADMLSSPHQQSDVYYRDWRALGVDYLLVGRLQLGANSVVAQFELFDVYGEKRILAGSETGVGADFRGVAHAVSDRVYERITGIRGAFSTRIMYVSAAKQGGGKFRYRLLQADVDGARETVILEQEQPILSPVWAPDGETIAYVSFETSRPAIFMQNLRTGKREQLTNFQGLNGAPAFSPDGRQLALVLSKDGSPDIYVMDIATRQLKRVTRHFAIDTEPSWMPDGKSIIYTSDRGGRPQIYQVTLANGYEERLTFEGRFNARARVIPDGSGLILVHQGEGDYHIARFDLRTGKIQVLTETSLDESPSISPNGAMLLYATKEQTKGILAAVSLDGGVKFKLPSKFGDVREPSWSPYLK